MRHQCLVVGAAKDMLTVAITDRQDISILTLLSKLTGRTIFPVLVDPVRMRLLVQRIERDERSRSNALRHSCFAYSLQLRSILMLLELWKRG